MSKSRQRRRGYLYDSAVPGHLTYQSGTGPVYHKYWSTHQMLGKSEVMYDVVGRMDSVNPCFHSRIDTQLRDIVGYSWTDWNDVTVDRYPIHWDVNSLRTVKSEAGVITPSDDAYVSFGDEAFYALTSQVPVLVDGAMLIADVFELRGLLKSLRSLLGKLLSFLSSLGLSWRRWSIRRLLAYLANAHLTVKFGIEATIADVERFINRFKQFGERLEFLRATAGKINTSHYAKLLASAKDLITYETNSTPGPTGYEPNIKEWYANPGYQCFAAATLRWRNGITGLESAYADYKALAAELGLNRPLSVLWELVPFSFVVDWFIPVNTFLDRYASIDMFGGSVDVIGATCSLKNTMSITLSANLAVTYNGNVVSTGKVTISDYYRQTSLPLSSGLCSSKEGLSANQQVILAALIAQRWR